MVWVRAEVKDIEPKKVKVWIHNPQGYKMLIIVDPREVGEVIPE